MRDLLWGLCLVLNVGTFVLFGVDKLQSRRPGRRRIRERTLLWCVFLGGMLGGWLAMGVFRHKTVKRSFRRWAMLWTLLSPVWLLAWWSWTSWIAA